MRRTLLVVALLLTPLLGGVARAGEAPPETDQSTSLSASSWRADLEYLIETLEVVHPDLYARVDREEFRGRADELAKRIPDLDDRDIALGMMQLVALIEDGHTLLEPTGLEAFDRWFPVRFYRFTDGIFITAASDSHASIVGSRVLRIGQFDAEEAWQRVESLLGADNRFGAAERAPFHLSNAAALAGLGVNPDTASLALELDDGSGATRRLEIESVAADYDLSFRFWGEIWGPASEKVTYVSAFGPSDDHYDESSTLPLHLRYRSSFWSHWLPEEKLYYVQIGHLGDSARRKQTFAEFNASIWKEVDRLDVDRLVLDIRYNIGGDGSLVQQFVHEIIKRDAINRKGVLFTVVGRTTFSAGVMLARALEEHTETTFVGEPAGAYWEHYGDGTSFELPSSGLTVWVSTIYHQLSAYAGDQRLLEIELPAPFASADYFAGVDPALDEIRAAADRPLIANVFRERGGEAGVAVYQERLEAYGGVDWWAPFTLQALNSLGHELLDAGRYEGALAAYRLNTRRYPEHWRVWYSLARAQRRHGDREAAIANYERALAADPFNNLAPNQREALEELRTPEAASP